MAIDVTATDNYTELETAEATAVDTVVAAIKAAYTQSIASSEKAHHDNIYMIIKQQNESQDSEATP